MKLLLTSDGITNVAIKKALLDLINKNPQEVKVAYITTAGSIVPKRKNWLIRDMNCYAGMFPFVDVLDFAALERNNWYSRLRSVDVLVFGGGNPFYLDFKLKKSGLSDLLGSEFADKVIVGVSAGSMVMGKYLAIPAHDESKKYVANNDQKALSFVDFSIIPHFNAVDSGRTLSEAKKEAIGFDGIKYAIDDDTAVVLDDDKLSIISEGRYEKFE